jgi:hypothetical protein
MTLIRTLDISKRSSSWAILAMSVFVCFYLAFVVLRIVLTHPSPGQSLADDWPQAAILVLFFAGTGCLVLWLGIRTRLTELTEEGLVQRGWSSRTEVPWSEIARVRGESLTLVLYDRTGRTYTLPWTVYRSPEDVKDFVKAHLHPSARWDVKESR